MDHPLMGDLASGDEPAAVLIARADTLVPLDEARGVVRDVLAAVRNVEHLLRSRTVGARALAKVVPGLHGLCDPLPGSVNQILMSVRAATTAPVDEAIAALGDFVGPVCDRLRTALAHASRAGALDAKARLAFESAIVRAGGELNSVRQLLDLLIEATEHGDTELDIEELVQVASSNPVSTVDALDGTVRVIATCRSDGSAFQTSPRVFMPLLAIAIASVRRDLRGLRDGRDLREKCACLYLEAVSRAGEPVIVTVAREGSPDGDELRFAPPVITPPSLICAQTAARLAGGLLAFAEDRAVLSWQRRAG